MLRGFLGLPERLDESFGDERVPALVGAVSRGEWDVCEWIVAEAPPGDERWFVCSEAAKRLGRIAAIARWVNERPSASAARLKALCRCHHAGRTGMVCIG